MVGVILPGGSKLGLGQRLLVAMADVLIGHPKPLSLDEHPNGDPTIADAGVAANHTWRFANYCRKGDRAVFRHDGSSFIVPVSS
jgi:hypothetical protein